LKSTTPVKVWVSIININNGNIDFAKINADGTIPVETVAPFDIAPGCIIDLLKMDREGSEWEILPVSDFLERTKNFCMEYHGSAEKAEELLSVTGHEIIEILGPREGCGLLWSRNKKLVAY